MDREAVDALIATIDGALGDRKTSRDAMRWVPDEGRHHDEDVFAGTPVPGITCAEAAAAIRSAFESLIDHEDANGVEWQRQIPRRRLSSEGEAE